MSELLITKCELCFNKFKNNSEDNYTFGYYSKRLGDKMICGSCVDQHNIHQTNGVRKK